VVRLNPSVRLQKLEQKEEREKENYFEIKLKMKKHVVGGKSLKLIFNSEWECQVVGMALDELANRIEDRFIDILNRPENVNYLRKAQKEYKQ
jgi:hypothetical protein